MLAAGDGLGADRKAPLGQTRRQRWSDVRPHLPIRDNVYLAVETGAAKVVAEGIENPIAGYDLSFFSHHHVASTMQ